ncbi:hypothetical protein BDZ89DRAFT_1131142 [Hymenopellis radicata]|nr:hypothetical protein BDZ89DRAFT_1131142 [Hymenopellis radicata]
MADAPQLQTIPFIMLPTPISTPFAPKPKAVSSEVAPACNLRTRLLKRRREEEEESSSARVIKEQTRERGRDKDTDVEDGTTEKSDTPSEEDDAELHAPTPDVPRENAHPIPYNVFLPHFPLNTAPPDRSTTPISNTRLFNPRICMTYSRTIMLSITLPICMATIRLPRMGRTTRRRPTRSFIREKEEVSIDLL